MSEHMYYNTHKALSFQGADGAGHRVGIQNLPAGGPTPIYPYIIPAPRGAQHLPQTADRTQCVRREAVRYRT